jgi:phage gp36-like protein
MYISLPQLADSPGALELAQTASDAHGAIVNAELLDATLRDQDRSAFDPSAVAQADAVKARILELIEEAQAIIDGYLGKRYNLPLATVPSLVGSWARAIVRYRLNKDRVGDERSDPIVRDYATTIKFLQQVAAGYFSLGLQDPTTVAHTESAVLIDPGVKAFGRGVLP